MSTATRRRPLPALAFLLALSILTGIVWWRVLHRPEPAGTASSPTAGPTASCTPKAQAIRLPTPASVTVVVLNGAGQDQLATKVTGQLKSRGFKVGKPDTTSALSGVGEIQYGSAGRAGATLLRYHLPGAKLAPTNHADARITLVLGAGFRSLAPVDTATRAVASASKPC
jgi:LytR cell envelope-related transcriptional attenuator